MGSGLLLGTGRLLGDMTASPTFFRGSLGGRLDHFAMDRFTLFRASDCTIQQDRYDSDHKPLVLRQESRLLLPQLPRLARLTFLASGYPICAGMDPSRVQISVDSIILVPSWLGVRIWSALGMLRLLFRNWVTFG